MNTIVPKGYKKTKVGVIPEDWEVVKVGEVCDCIVPGRNKPKNFDGNIPWVTTPDIVGKYISETKSNLYISVDEAKKIGSKIVPKNSVIMSCVGELGLLSIVKNEIVINQQLHAFLPSDKVRTEFLHYALNAQRKYMESVATKTAVPYMNKDNCNSIPIPLPPLKEQEKIAEILTTWDEAITKQEELIKAKELQKKGLMQKLLSGEVRFSGFSGEWEEVRLGEIGEIVTGATPPTDIKAYYENGQFPWITPTDINDKKDIHKSERYLTLLGLKKGKFIPKGSLLVTCIASIGKNAILKVDGSCNQQINAILPSEKNNTNYLYYFIEFKKNYLIKFAGQSATQILNKKSFSSLKIKLPSLPEQQKIAEVLSLADDEINLLKKELAELKQQKKGLMQKLLTGETRVKV